MALLGGGFSLACVIAVVGCYAPRVRDCALSCATDADCVNGQRCGTAGLCAAPALMNSCTGDAAATDAGRDAGRERDARDATEHADCDASACAGAGGTCAGNTCVIDAGVGPVTCPAGETCAITCAGDMACDRGIDCSAALSCHIACTGGHACSRAVVTCGGAGCVVECVGDRSCSALSLDCTGTSCIYDFGGPGCGQHSCPSMGPDRCSCDGAGCTAGNTCP